MCIHKLHWVIAVIIYDDQLTLSRFIILSPTAGSNKEWKPKPTTNTINPGSGPASSSEATAVLAEETGKSQSVSCVLDSEEASSKLQRKLEDLHLPQRHVILPNHIYVPDSEKTKFSFGSLGNTFGVNTSYSSGPESDKSSTPLSETSQAVEETTDEQASRCDAECFHLNCSYSKTWGLDLSLTISLRNHK